MTTRHLWRVHTPGGADLTVIAEIPGDAVDYAMDYCDDSDDDSREQYTATEAPGGGLRWVGFESAEDAANQVRDIDAHGVTVDRLLTRTTSRPGVGEVLWEVGARDADWCLLPSGVLCGGAD